MYDNFKMIKSKLYKNSELSKISKHKSSRFDMLFKSFMFQALSLLFSESVLIKRGYVGNTKFRGVLWEDLLVGTYIKINDQLHDGI